MVYKIQDVRWDIMCIDTHLCIISKVIGVSKEK